MGDAYTEDDDTEDVFGVDSEAMSEKERKKGSSVSIDVTKALVILGFSNWSDLDDQGKLYTCIKQIAIHSKN